MTSGSVSLKTFSWPLKTKKRHRSGSGGSKDHEAKKKSFLSRKLHNSTNSPNVNRRKGSLDSVSSKKCSLEVAAPVSSDVEFKFNWPIENFLQLAKGRSPSKSSLNGGGGDYSEDVSYSSAGNGGLDSKPFEVNLNGVHSTWNLSIRFWTGEDGERLANPFVLCLNMLGCKVRKAKAKTLGVKFKFGVLNRVNGEFEVGSPEVKSDLPLENTGELRSIGYKNIAISDKHVNSDGDIELVCKLRLLLDDSENHSLSSDLRGLINDEKSSDLVLQAGGKSFNVHKSILSARSAVFADLLEKNEKEEEEEKAEAEAVEKEVETNCQSGREIHSESKEEIKTVAEVEVESKENKVEVEEKTRSRSGSNSSMNKCKTLTLKDLNSDTLEELLSYIYTDSSVNVDVMSKSLLMAADSYKLPGLKTHCEKHLGEILSPNNVASVLMLADRYECSSLKKSALGYCKVNHTYIMKDSHWKTIEEEKPGLFEEAVAGVVEGATCHAHDECLKKRGKRFEMEKNSSEINVCQ